MIFSSSLLRVSLQTLKGLFGLGTFCVFREDWATVDLTTTIWQQEVLRFAQYC